MIFAFLSLSLSLTIAKRGEESKYVIIYPANDASAKNASNYLRIYINNLTSVSIPVKEDKEFTKCPDLCILIGNTSFTNPIMTPVNFSDDDSFHLETIDGKFIIYGGIRGVHYGVMEILERFGGVRWLSLDQTHIPRLDNFSVDIKIEEQTPDFPLRAVWWSAINQGSRAYNCRLNHQHKIPSEQGGAVQWGGGWNVHTFFKYMPPNKYFKDHPEWYSLINGRRISTGQLCISNAEMRKELIKNVLELIKNDTQRVSGTVYSVSQNDNGDACQCQECKKIRDQYGGVESALLVWLDNQIGEEVEKAYPGENIYIEFLSYWYTIDSPKNIKPRWNVIPRLCPINNDMTRPFNESTAEINKRFAKQIGEWRAISQNMMIWDYTGAFQQMIAIYPNMYSLQANIQLFKDHHAMAIFSQGSNDHSFFSELKTYVIAKMLWNTKANFTAICNEFIELYYGKAAPLIKKFLTECHEVVLARTDILMHCEMIVTDVDWFDGNLLRWMNMFRQAAYEVKDDELMSYHVYKSRSSAIFMKYSRILEERANMTFSWNIGGDYVSPVNPPARSQKLAKWLVDCILSPRSIQIGEIAWRHHDELLKIDICVHGYNITKIESNKYLCGVSVDYTGRLGYLIDKKDQINYIDGNFGGIDIGNKAGIITVLSVVRHDKTKSNSSYIEVDKHEVSGECKINKKYSITDDGLKFNVTIKADDWIDTPVRTVSSFALVIGDCGNVFVQLDGGDYEEYVASYGEHEMHFSIAGSRLAGKKSIVFCSPVTKRGVQVHLPNVTFEHLICFVYPDNGTIRAIFTQPKVTMKPLEVDSRGNWFISPLKDISDIPKPSTRPGYKDASIFKYSIEDSTINAKAAEIVKDADSNLTYAAHLLCTDTTTAITRKIDFENTSSPYEVLVHAKVSIKDENDIIKSVIKCDGKESFVGVINSSVIEEGKYEWYSFGEWNMINNCQISFSAEKGAKSINIDEFALSYLGSDSDDDDKDKDKKKKLWIAIGASLGGIALIIIVVIIIVIKRKKKDNNVDGNVLSTKKLLTDDHDN